MKKKIIVLSVAVALVALIVGGSLAWFIDTDSVKNTFTVGEIKITQHEQEHDEDGNLQDFTQNQVLLPLVNVDGTGKLNVDDEINAQDINYVEKLVRVENVGKNDAYIRTFIAVPATIKDILILDVNTSDGWTKDEKSWPTVTVNGLKYAIVSFTYEKAIANGEFTPYNLKGVYIDPSVDAQINPDNGKKQFCTLNSDGTYTYYNYDITGEVNVLVATQGGQVPGFEDKTVSEALDTVFPTAPDFSDVQ